ncbi:MAG: four helix bundle protein [Flavobacteriales bacterium]|nr:four helix bundle protein [Flavobacteriales bacterium]MCB9447269.1 four helix bundle protein [Flavobacteriales bacterium]
MFDFQRLDVYHKAKQLHKDVVQFLKEAKTDSVTNDQLKRASFSIMLNIAEGAGRFTKRDKKNFFIVARGSVFECAGIFDYLRDLHPKAEGSCQDFLNKLEELSKMLYSMIRKLSE